MNKNTSRLQAFMTGAGVGLIIVPWLYIGWQLWGWLIGLHCQCGG